MNRTQWAAITAVVLALLFAGAAAVASAGGGDSTSESTSRTPSAESADAGFARDMSVHHQQAVEMSFIVRDRTQDDEVRRLAYDIANTQANQRGMMLGWLDLWGLPKLSADSEPMAWMMPVRMAERTITAIVCHHRPDTSWRERFRALRPRRSSTTSPACG